MKSWRTIAPTDSGNYLDVEYGLARRYPVEVNYIGEDWDKLRELAAASTSLPGREEVLAIIDNTDIFKGREKKLMDLQGGVPYNFMMSGIFPLLRRVEIVVEYDLHRIIEERYRRKLTEAEFQEILIRERAAAEAAELRLAELRRQEAEQQQRAEQMRLEAERAEQARREEAERLREQQFREKWLAERAAKKQAQRAAREQRNRLTPLLAVKTNLYAWAGMTPDFDYTAFTPNLSAELFFARRWSAVASAAYANWDYDGDRGHWGISAYSIEPRFWVNGDGRYRWCYVGVYGQLGDFDNRSADSGRIAESTGNCTGTYWEGGLSAGCYFLLNTHWGIEVGLRGGYRSSDVNAYEVEAPYHYFDRNFRENSFWSDGSEYKHQLPVWQPEVKVRKEFGNENDKPCLALCLANRFSGVYGDRAGLSERRRNGCNSTRLERFCLSGFCLLPLLCGGQRRGGL